MEDKKFSLFRMFIVFFKIGAFTIGGGLAMIPVIQHELVDKQKWIDEKEIVDLLAIAQSLPGVIAINSSIYVGYKCAGIIGAVVATAGVVMPSFVIILVIAFLLSNFADLWYVQKMFAGVRAGVTALIAIATYKLMKSAIVNVMGVVIAVIAFISLGFWKLDIAYVVISAAIIGIISGKLKGKTQ